MTHPHVRPLAGLTLLALAAGAAAPGTGQAQLLRTDRWGRTVSDVQGYNLAGGGDYVEGYWPVYGRFRTAGAPGAATVATIEAGRATATDTEVRGIANWGLGGEVRWALPSTPWLFGTAEYRRERYNDFRIYTASGNTGFTRIPGDAAAFAGIGRIGIGAAIPNTPFYGRYEYSFIYLSGLNVDQRFDGYGLHGGVAQPVFSWLGVRAEAGYQSLHDLGAGFEWKAGVNLNLTPNVALTGAYRQTQLHDNPSNTSTRFADATVGLRFQFAR